MQYKQLGNSDLTVSEICLGTMTFGQQNSLEEACGQLDFAVDRGVNFIDAAEMYPVPARAETYGKTEEYIGRWLSGKPRDRFVIATKIAGPTRSMPWIRSADRQVDRPNIERAVEDSLKRLQTDYIDLYQIHWPDRYVPLFGGDKYDPKNERKTVSIQEQLMVFAELIEAGKIRYLGLSNETPWGVCQFCHLADRLGLPRIVSIQNAYHLLNREFEIALAETCHLEKVGLLAYSPLAFGFLTGKYQQETPPNSRIGLFPMFGGRYKKPYVQETLDAYLNIARKYDLIPAQMALAFVRSRWFVTSTIIGATNLEQLEENLSSLKVELSEEILKEINEIHAQHPNPTP
ncbi:MAG TPA: aldo/keto reductase [Oscillatoriales cyanobacterium M59_W2019_021]|nr:aldo/keto reductase [Oscillatoriales cyanobacterium M4454_W2019_049]HIK50153.1 aldo/keto reductase [Oscillatoriales cyanobacterium M59_W2019_021]